MHAGCCSGVTRLLYVDCCSGVTRSARRWQPSQTATQINSATHPLSTKTRSSFEAMWECGTACCHSHMPRLGLRTQLHGHLHVHQQSPPENQPRMQNPSCMTSHSMHLQIYQHDTLPQRHQEYTLPSRHHHQLHTRRHTREFREAQKYDKACSSQGQHPFRRLQSRKALACALA